VAQSRSSTAAYAEALLASARPAAAGRDPRHNILKVRAKMTRPISADERRYRPIAWTLDARRSPVVNEEGSDRPSERELVAAEIVGTEDPVMRSRSPASRSSRADSVIWEADSHDRKVSPEDEQRLRSAVEAGAPRMGEFGSEGGAPQRFEPGDRNSSCDWTVFASIDFALGTADRVRRTRTGDRRVSLRLRGAAKRQRC